MNHWHKTSLLINIKQLKGQFHFTTGTGQNRLTFLGAAIPSSDEFSLFLKKGPQLEQRGHARMSQTYFIRVKHFAYKHQLDHLQLTFFILFLKEKKVCEYSYKVIVLNYANHSAIIALIYVRILANFKTKTGLTKC